MNNFPAIYHLKDMPRILEKITTQNGFYAERE